MIAPETAATITAQRTSPWEAATPPRITVISPGKTNPTNADASSAGNANTRTTTIQPSSKRMCSGMLPMTPSPNPSTFRFPPDERSGTEPKLASRLSGCPPCVDVAQRERMLPADEQDWDSADWAPKGYGLRTAARHTFHVTPALLGCQSTR